MVEGTVNVTWDVARRDEDVARWRGGGDAEPNYASPRAELTVGRSSTTPAADSELRELRVRLTAVENLVIGLLSAATPEERRRAREVALRRSSKPARHDHQRAIAPGDA